MKRAALIYQGIPRSINYTYLSHETYVKNCLKKLNIEPLTYIHFWRTKNNKQKLWDKPVKNPLNNELYKLLKPDFYQTDSQELFLENLNFENFFYKYDKAEWCPNLLKNHLCSLESTKRCFNLVKASGVTPDYIFFLRPDALFKNAIVNDIDINTLNCHPNSVLIPSFASFEGYNDRFAALNYKGSDHYFERINYAKEFRKTNGRIVAEKF